ncbi:PREDICTED: uncharacterized protein LOC108369666 isoform X2 [Rhagoletis zephyria]|uniref:uncharacterized protein LOC108369666 isoform X2 n=1 Tax=Rhagoletis zephyria TaxID=28612 RepID=UPI0008117576|nr:PREDICTED: uncharacterized protein LOC108369666 isoform X2 [Rhagoletis zephyria]
MKRIHQRRLPHPTTTSMYLMKQQILSENQSLICEKLNYIMENSTPKCETSAQHQLLRECKVSIKKVEHSVCRMTGELRDKHMDDVASALPLQTSIAVLNVEDNLKIPEYARAMTSHLHKIKGVSEDVPSVVRQIFTDKLMGAYNWDGRCEKQALVKLKLFDSFLREIFKLQGSFDFERGVKKAVELSHHRMSQKKFAKKSKKEAH